MLNAQLKADHDLLWDALIGASNGDTSYLPEVGGYLNAMQDRWWMVWKCQQLLAPPGACVCHLLPDLVTWQMIRKIYRDHVQATDDFYELCLEIEASARDWETLRGSAARKKQLEMRIGVRKRKQGRPPRVFLTEVDRETAELILDHVRDVGWEHLGRVLLDRFVARTTAELDDNAGWGYMQRDSTDRLIARWMAACDDIRSSWCPWPALDYYRIQNATAVVRKTLHMSARAYRRSHRSLASRLLAAVGDCTFESTRKDLPNTLDSADGEMDQVRLRRAAEILLRVERRRAAADPDSVGQVDSARLDSVAETMEASSKELKERLQRRGVFRRAEDVQTSRGRD